MKISASQLKKFDLCPKMWFLEKIEKIPQGPPHYGATFGTVLHGCLERLQKGEEVYPEDWASPLRFGDDELIQDLVSMYKPLADEVKVEERFEVDLIEDITLVGYIDLLLDGHVIDHKSTSSFKWALSAEELGRDLQMLVYAKYALDQLPKPRPIKLQHNVFLRKLPAKRRTTVAHVSPGAILERWGEIQNTALEMKRVAAGSCPEVAMGSQCHAYGGCPYASMCAGTISRGQLEKKMGAFEDRLAEIAANKKNNKPPPAAVAVAERKVARLVVTERPTPADVEELQVTTGSQEAAAVRELQGKPPEEIPVKVVKKKRKRGRPRKTPAFEAESPTPTKTSLTVYVGCLPKVRGEVFLTLEDAFKQVVGDPEAYFAEDAFKRRDALVGRVGQWWGSRESDVSVMTSPSNTWGPDEKALVFALKLRAGQIVQAC